eukprot:GILK01002640.1.p1 GENE.GILK01002640.1~~GILK01002640.1.p1  ORF type:complete len:539 (-),score=79.70 GILK01002640.1:115-1674(-)
MADVWRNNVEVIKEKLRAQAHATQKEGMAQIEWVFQQFDRDHNGLLSRREFEELLAYCGLYLRTQEISALFRHFNTNGDGTLSYQEFLEGLRAPLSGKRLDLVRSAFQHLDVDGQGHISSNYLMSRFNAAKHPRVVTRVKREDDVRREFSNCLSRFPELLAESDFIELYTDISASVPSHQEKYFEELLLGVWDLKDTVRFSDQTVSDIELLLAEKIRQRTHGAEDEAKSLLKSFKFFDLNNRGSIGFKPFCQALAKFGMAHHEAELRVLFDQFDFDHSGLVVYEDFVNAFRAPVSYRLDRSGMRHTISTSRFTSSVTNHIFAPLTASVSTRTPPRSVFEKIKLHVLKRTSHGVRHLSHLIAQADRDQHGFLTRREFSWCLKQAGVDLAPAELDLLVKYYDIKGQDRIDYGQFVLDVRGDLNQARFDLIQRAWSQIDREGTGHASADDLLNAYDATKHPKVLAGDWRPEQACDDLLSQWSPSREDGHITYEDFENFYRDVGASIARDDEFEVLVRNCWHC